MQTTFSLVTKKRILLLFVILMTCLLLALSLSLFFSWAGTQA